jgi:CPA1 family monovalent cation:H+ antiporter
VLAVVACGLYLSRRSANFFSPAVRIKIWSVWEALTFVLNGVIFVLIGLQLPAIRASLQGYTIPTLLLYGAVFSLLLILLRLLWVFPSARLAYWVRIRIAHQNELQPTLRQVFVVGWTGMRGVVSLAAALAIPATVATGAPFPRRNVIVFLTFCVIVVTLAVQGLTLPPLIRMLNLGGATGPNCEEQEARRLMTEAALSYLDAAQTKDEDAFAEVYQDLVLHYRQRLATLPADAEARESAEHNRHVALTVDSLRVERTTAIRLRDQGRINDEVLRRLERELDLNEARLINSED